MRLAVLLAASLLVIASQLPSVFAVESLAAHQMQQSLQNLDVKEAIRLSPSFLEKLLEVGDDGSTASKCSVLTLRGIASTRKGDPSTAAGHYREAIAIDPKEASLHWLLARAYGETGEHEMGIRSCETAIQIDPDFVPAVLTLAALQIEHQDPETAKETLETHLPIASNEVDSCYRFFILGVIQMKQADFASAAKSFEDSLDGASDYFALRTSRLWYLKAVAEHRSQKNDRALLSVRRAIEDDSNGPEDAFLLMWSLTQKKGWNVAALEVAEIAIAKHPNSTRSHAALLSTLMHLKQFKAAREVSKRILQIDPEHAFARKINDRLNVAIKSGLKRVTY